MSRAFTPINAEPRAAQTKSARIVQRRCSSCANSTRSTSSCSECDKKKRRPFQARLQVSTPGDAGEREAERAADDVMHGRLPQVQARSSLDLLQRQETQTGSPPPIAGDTRPETPPADGGAGSGSGSTAGAGAASPTPTCTPTGFTRANFLTQPGTSVNEFGLTRLSISAVTQPSVATSRVRGGVRIDSTTAALPTIPSVFTGADTFTEGTAHFVDQDHTSGCSSGRLPIRWTITTAGADRISAGEQEHCADFQLAFDLSLRRFAAAVNTLAAAGTVFADQARAERAVTRRVGVAPADWSTVFTCLARKTLDRDRLNLHLPRPITRSPRPADGCAFVRSIVSGTSLPRVGTLPSADLVRDCGENGTSPGSGTGSGSPGSRRRGSGSVGKPDLSNATWESSDYDEDEAPLLQRDALNPTAAAVTPAHDATVDQALFSPGLPLDGASRAFMESRFAHDFSQVRIHTDAAAAASAEALRAHAYTAGRDIVFNSGAYAPHTEHGRHLLAHELAHVVQQNRSEPLMQRDEKPGAKKPPATATKVDVSIVLSDDEQDMAEGRAYAKTVLRVTDPTDAATKLKALGVPIGTLYVVSHSSSAGDVEFISAIGTISWKPISELAKEIKSAATVDHVDFRGCKIGQAAAALESFRKSVGAQTTKGANCWTFVQRATPLTVDGVDITSPSQIPKGRQADFDKALLKQVQGMVSEDNKPVGQCLLGLAKGDKVGVKTLTKIWAQYWANQGNLVASWASPDFNKTWQAGSICINHMTETTTPCGLVITKAPVAAPSPAPSGKSSALEERVMPGIEVNTIGQQGPQINEGTA